MLSQVNVVVGAFFVLNFFIWGQASSGAMPLGTMLALLLMWFGISTPLVFVGAFFGFKAKITDPPTRIGSSNPPVTIDPPHPGEEETMDTDEDQSEGDTSDAGSDSPPPHQVHTE